MKIKLFIFLMILLIIPISLAEDYTREIETFNCSGTLFAKIEPLDSSEAFVQKCNLNGDLFWECSCNDAVQPLILQTNTTEKEYNVRVQYNIENLDNLSEEETLRTFETLITIPSEEESKSENFESVNILLVVILVFGVIIVVGIIITVALILLFKEEPKKENNVKKKISKTEIPPNFFEEVLHKR